MKGVPCTLTIVYPLPEGYTGSVDSAPRGFDQARPRRNRRIAAPVNTWLKWAQEMEPVGVHPTQTST